jgi:hypothetical protein
VSAKNLMDIDPDPVVSLCHHSHPTLIQRCEAITKLLDAKSAGGRKSGSKSKKHD